MYKYISHQNFELTYSTPLRISFCVTVPQQQGPLLTSTEYFTLWPEITDPLTFMLPDRVMSTVCSSLFLEVISGSVMSKPTAIALDRICRLFIHF